MEFEYRKLSEKRAGEIDASGVKDNNGRNLDINSSRSVTTEDETVVFQQIYFAKNYNVENEKDAFILVYKNNYYIVYARSTIRGVAKDGGQHRYYTYNVSSIIKELGNEELTLKQILSILKQVLYVISDFSLRPRPENKTFIELLYNGEEA